MRGKERDPRFFAYFPANTSFASILGEMLAAGLGVNSMLWETAPAATELEDVVMRWMANLIDLPPGLTGMIQDSASIATLCSLICARERATDFASHEDGLTSIGRPLSVYGEICKEYRVWFHVDAALAGTAAILPERRHVLDGVELCDSFTFNPSKWMLTNLPCTAHYIRNVAEWKRAFGVHPEYLETHRRTGRRNSYEWGLRLGRGFPALKLWFVLRSFGAEGLRGMVRTHIELAQELAGWVRGDRRFELMAPVPLNMVCFRVRGPGDEAANAPGGGAAGRISAMSSLPSNPGCLERSSCYHGLAGSDSVAAMPRATEPTSVTDTLEQLRATLGGTIQTLAAARPGDFAKNPSGSAEDQAFRQRFGGAQWLETQLEGLPASIVTGQRTVLHRSHVVPYQTVLVVARGGDARSLWREQAMDTPHGRMQWIPFYASAGTIIEAEWLTDTKPTLNGSHGYRFIGCYGGVLFATVLSPVLEAQSALAALRELTALAKLEWRPRAPADIKARRRLEMGLRVAVGLLFGGMIVVMVIQAYLAGSK